MYQVFLLLLLVLLGGVGGVKCWGGGGGGLSHRTLMCWENGSRSKTGSVVGFVHVGEFTVMT